MADDKKIIIDEDWKSRVQAEKNAAAASPTAETPPRAAGTARPELADVPMQPASFELLLTTLATEALVALGEVPHPTSGTAHVAPNQAKYLIDTIDVLRHKTKGNLTVGEQHAIDGLLHQLRMVFVTKVNQSGPESSVARPS